MALHERYLPDLNLMLILGVGTVTAEDFTALLDRERDADSARDRDVLIDLRQIEALVLSEDVFRLLIAQDAEFHESGVFTKGRRRAVVGRGDLEDAMVSLYQALLRRHPNAAPVAAATVSFTEIGDAIAYLQREDVAGCVEAALEALARDARPGPARG